MNASDYTIGGFEEMQARIESQAREIELLSSWKREQMEVMGPVFDYAQLVCTGPLGCSITEWLISDHKEKALEIERLQSLCDHNKFCAQTMSDLVDDQEQQLAALKAQPSGVVLSELLQAVVDHCDEGQLPDALYNQLIDEVARLNQTASGQESVAWQFYQDGKWWIGSGHHNHRANTEEAGIPVRDLYARPLQQPASAGDELEVLREYRNASINYNNSHGVETESLEEAVEVERQAENRLEAAEKACHDFYAGRTFNTGGLAAQIRKAQAEVATWPDDIREQNWISAGEPFKCQTCNDSGVVSTTDKDHNGDHIERRCPVCAGGVDERAAFEAFAKSTPYGSQLHYVRDALPKDDPRYGEYVSEALRLSWEGWQARAALTASAPSQGEQVREDAKRLDFMLTKCRKVIVERLPHDNFEVYVEEGFLGDKRYPSVRCSGYWETGEPYALAIQREAIDAAMLAAAPSAGSQKEQGE